MKTMQFFSRSLAIATLFAFLAASATAQTTYNWTGGITNDPWNDATHWDQATPAGSILNGGALDDDVVIQNQLASGTQNVRLNVDAGTIGTLTVGGNATTSVNNTNFQVRTNAGALNVTGDLTLGGLGGATGTTETAGQFQMNNGNSQVTIGGNIVSSGSSSANRVVLDAGTGANLNLLGNFGSVTDNGVDLWINRTDALTTVAGSTLHVDNFRVGTAFSGTRTGTSRVWDLDGGRTIEATSMNIGFLDGNNATNHTVEGTLNITNATANVSGAIQVGQTNSTTATGERDVTGVINVGVGGTLTSANTLFVGNMNQTTVNAGSTSMGTVNLTDATSVASVQFTTVGANLRGEGVVNVDAGTFTSNSRVYLGGDENNGDDAGTTGTFNLTNGGTLTVSAGNTEVGRGGAGFLNVDNSTYNQVNNNLVLGQSRGGGATTQVATGTVMFTNGAQVTIGTASNDINFNRGGGSITVDGATTVVNVGRNVNMADEGTSAGGSFSSNFTINEGTVNVGVNVAVDADNSGSFNNASSGQGSIGTVNLNGGTLNIANDFTNAAANATGVVNINGGTLNVSDTLQVVNNNAAVSGTVNITGGDVNIGTGGPNQNLNLSSGTGAGTVNMTGGTLDVANNVDFRGGAGVDMFTVSGDSAVTIANNLDMNGGTAANVNQLNLVNDGNASFTVDGNVLLDNNAQLTFDFMNANGGSLAIDAGDGNVTMTDADIVFNFNDITSASLFSRIDLINATGTQTGAFSSFAFGDTVETFGDGSSYELLSDGSGVFLSAVVAVPEPSSLALLGLCGAGVAIRRRRRS
jgi:hypothetical protein